MLRLLFFKKSNPLHCRPTLFITHFIKAGQYLQLQKEMETGTTVYIQ